MLANNNNQFDVLIGFLTSKFEELPDKIDSQEFISKFDALIGLQIDKNAIEKLKQFIEFCYNKMQDLRVSKENEINFQQKYSKDLVLRLNSLEERVKTLSNKIEELNKEKQANNMANELNKSINNNLKDNIKKLETKISVLEDENNELKNEREKQKKYNNEIDSKISCLNIFLSGFNKKNKELENKNKEFENKNKDLKVNINKLETKISENFWFKCSTFHLE